MNIVASILLLSAGAAASAPVNEWPSAAFVAEKSRHTINVRGHLLSERAKERFVAAATAAGAEITSFEYGRYIVLPDWWPSAVDAMVPLADLMHSGEIRLSRTELVLEAMANEDDRWAEAMMALEQALPAGFPVIRQVSSVAAGGKAVVCDRLFGSLDREPLLFRRTSASVKTEDYGRLNRLAATLRRCPDIAVRIVGHSDAFGMASRNQAVSEQRARAVVSYLTALGVADSQLAWEARGDREPAATNETWEGRNLNRRVTITRLD